ncbi:Uncharacterized protein SCF082_LOCUS46557 [Durusdinium trenchii]|uniref:Uncharacterized protein n=1 Tax=Durusdinium trenchii TaxID=1381693 RepID=A0ABP0RFQ3_9DINO
MDEFWLPLSAFDYTATAKNGFFPANTQLTTHFHEFAKFGYKSNIGNVECKFPLRDSSRQIPDFSVGVTDGHCKIVLMMTIVAIVRELDLNLDDPHLQMVLASFSQIRCSYEHFENPAHFYLYSLKTGFVSAEKQGPSPVQLVAELQHAVDLQRRQTHAKNAPLRDILNRVIADYNKMVSVKKHRLDSSKKSLVLNLMRCPSDLMTLLAKHYDSYKENLEWQRISFVLEATGKNLETYVEKHQDQSRNALKKSMEAAFNAWVEELHADQTQFMADKDCHSRAWDAVAAYMEKHIKVFSSRKSAKQEDTEKKEDTSDVKMDDENDDDDDRDSALKLEESEEIQVRDIRYNLETQLALKDRNLKVRNITWIFEPDTVYGKRDGVLTGLAVTHKDSRNYFHSTRGWKTGTVHGIGMCPRAEMYKPETASPSRAHALPHLGRAFTDIQEQKQDLLNRLSNAVYEQARAGDLQVTFPSFDPILSALKSGSTANAARSYRVTCQRHDQLLVLESFAKRWLDDPQFDERAREVIKLHNEEYNASEDFMMAAERSEPKVEEEASLERPAKRIKLEACKTEDVTKLAKSKLVQLWERRMEGRCCALPAIARFSPRLKVVEDDTTKKEKGRKKKTAPAITSKNFGAFVSVPAIKDADNMVLAWRIDNSGAASKGAKLIMPIRPVMCLKHQLEVNSETVCLV